MSFLCPNSDEVAHHQSYLPGTIVQRNNLPAEFATVTILDASLLLYVYICFLLLALIHLHHVFLSLSTLLFYFTLLHVSAQCTLDKYASSEGMLVPRRRKINYHDIFNILNITNISSGNFRYIMYKINSFQSVYMCPIYITKLT